MFSGPSVLAGVSVLMILILINGYIISKIQKLQMKQMKHKDERVKLTNEVLSGIKVRFCKSLSLTPYEVEYSELNDHIPRTH